MKDNIRKMPDNEAYSLLERYKIPVAKYTFIKNSKKFADNVEKAISSYPVVIKIDGDVIHKKKAGCVEILYKKEDAKKSIENIIKNSKGFKVNGMIVQEFIQGKEVIVGAKRDQQFGTILLFGSGGVLADIMQDVSFRTIPVDIIDIELMVKETKAYQFLIEENESFLEDVIDVLEKVSILMQDNVEIKELDINPFFLSGKSVAGDVRIMR